MLIYFYLQIYYLPIVSIGNFNRFVQLNKPTTVNMQNYIIFKPNANIFEKNRKFF